MSKLLLALAALLALLALADAQCTGTYCCPCFCCDQTWNGRCNHWSPKVKCISDKRGCTSTCFRMKGIDGASCRNGWGAYPTQDCSSCRRGAPGANPFLVSPAEQEALDAQVAQVEDVAQELPEEVFVAEAEETVWVKEEPEMLQDEAQETQVATKEEVEKAFPAEPQAANTCSYWCHSCMCCTKSQNRVCLLAQRQNVCSTSDSGSKVCGAWLDTRMQGCTMGWPFKKKRVSSCSDGCL